jgi:hypothetical protein
MGDTALVGVEMHAAAAAALVAVLRSFGVGEVIG